MRHFIIILVSILLLIGCGAKLDVEPAAQPSGGDMSLAGKKILMVIANFIGS